MFNFLKGNADETGHESARDPAEAGLGSVFGCWLTCKLSCLAIALSGVLPATDVKQLPLVSSMSFLASAEGFSPLSVTAIHTFTCSCEIMSHQDPTFLSLALLSVSCVLALVVLFFIHGCCLNKNTALLTGVQGFGHLIKSKVDGLVRTCLNRRALAHLFGFFA